MRPPHSFPWRLGKNGNEEGVVPIHATVSLATARFMLRDQAGYRITCKQLLDRYGTKAADAEASMIATVCAGGEHAVDDVEAVVAVAKRAGQKYPTFAVTLGLCNLERGTPKKPWQRSKARAPGSVVALALAPEAADPIRCGQLVGELCLAMCYRKLGDEGAVFSQIKKVRALVKQLEVSPRMYFNVLPGLDLDLVPWLVPFAIEWANRELATLELKGQPAKK